MKVVSVSKDAAHNFSKQVTGRLQLLAGVGVAGDAHAGVTVQHRSRVRENPNQPNLRQVHLIHAELLDELTAQGFTVRPGHLGENILTRGVDLLAFPRGAVLHFGVSGASVQITGLRNPCAQIEDFQPGLLQAVLGRDREGNLIRKAGVMGIVLTSGSVSVGDEIRVEFPPEPHEALERV